MKRKFLTALLTASLTVSAAQGGAVVYDPTNFIQNTISALQSIRSTILEAQQISQQIMQLQNEVQMIVNQGKMLAHLPTSLQSEIMNSFRSLETVMAGSRGIVQDYKGLQIQFDDLFTTPDYSGWKGADYQKSVEDLTKETLASANNAMEAQGLIADLSDDNMALDSLMSASKSASGQLAALQAANEISGLMTTNLMRLETIVASSAKVQTTHIAADAKLKQDNAAKWQASIEKLLATIAIDPSFTPVNDASYLNPIGTKKGAK
ncbi:hypothetical protein [Paremcibacter congregatus]|uniref:hypothetical protein n=1 Tax=Paremcibacter congregatus TaxID=2043170 RepID=UPI003A92781D